MNECQIEESLLSKLLELKYTHRPTFPSSGDAVATSAGGGAS